MFLPPTLNLSIRFKCFTFNYLSMNILNAIADYSIVYKSERSFSFFEISYQNVSLAKNKSYKQLHKKSITALTKPCGSKACLNIFAKWGLLVFNFSLLSDYLHHTNQPELCPSRMHATKTVAPLARTSFPLWIKHTAVRALPIPIQQTPSP